MPPSHCLSPFCCSFFPLSRRDTCASGGALTQVAPSHPAEKQCDVITKLKLGFYQSEGLGSQGSAPPLLTWQVTQKKMPWNIVLLLGGGFALAKGSEVKLYFYDENILSASKQLRTVSCFHIRSLVCPGGSALRWLRCTPSLRGPSPLSSASSLPPSLSVLATSPRQRSSCLSSPPW